MKPLIENYSSVQKTEGNALLVLLLASFVLLLAIGTTNLFSAVAGTEIFWTQIRHLAVSLGAFTFFGFFVSTRTLNTYAYALFALVGAALLFVLFTGHIAGGAQRWINLGIIRFQPSEAAKISIAVFVAKFFYNSRNLHCYYLSDLKGLVFGILLYFSLIFLQPDFGTAGMCVLVAATQIAFVKIIIGRRTFFGIISLGLACVFVGWNFLLRPYQKLRVMTLLNPSHDPMGAGYNSLQSLVAVGSGGSWGKGFLQGTQTQLQFLPARQTDFIFSVFAEEHGFWGGACVFALFTILSLCALEIARRSKDSFNTLLALGITALIFVEFVINVAMVLGIFPVVGMPLPFFSYGGSSLLTSCVGIGMLVAIERVARSNR